MATTPASNFQPAFTRVQQAGRHDDTFAVIAMLGGTTLDAVRTQAEALGVPKTGPYFSWIDGDLIAKLLIGFGLVATVWKESKDWKDLPDVAIALVDYSVDWEVGRCVLYHRMPAGKDGKGVQYVIDPYMHADPKLHIRTDLTGLVPSWYIGVHPQPQAQKK